MLAYIDSFAGLVPCKVLSIEESPNGVRYVKVQVTSRTHGKFDYRCGNILEFTSLCIIPRDKVIRRKSMGGARILPYDWADYMHIQLSLDSNR